MYAKISFTNACNGKCQTCLVPNLGQERTYICPNKYRRIVDKLANAGMDCLHMYNIGESYLHPSHTEMFKYGIENFGSRTVIISNGELVDSIPKGVGVFIFSFNGGNRWDYERTTGLPFEKVLKNIRRLRDEGQFHNAKSVEIHMLSCHYNSFSSEQFERLFEDMKYQVKLRVSVKMDNQCGTIGPVAHCSDRIPCDYLNVLNIHCDGSVIMCAHDFHAQNRWGDMDADPLWRIFNWPERRKKIEEHAKGDYTGLCQRCNYNVRPTEVKYV